jgi:NADH dehydrogenase
MILVTGGSGFVGQETVAELLRLGQRVRLLVRNPDKAGKLPFARQVEFVRGDVLQPETLPAALAGVKVVIHLVGFILETPRISYEQGHFQATRNVLAAAQAAGVTRWIQMSAAGTRPHARSRYHQTKWRAEELVRQSGLDWTIFRPSLIYGYDERDRLLNLLKRVLTFPVDLIQLDSLPLIDGGRPLVQPVSVREVARCFAAAPVKAAAIGRAFDLVGPVAMSWREMVLKILAVLGRHGLYEEIPLLLLLRAALWFAMLAVALLTAILFAAGSLGAAGAILGVVLFAALAFACASWRTVIIFNLSGELVIQASEVLNVIAPQGLRPSEALKMSVEDNIGDPRPAAEVFGYEPEPFEEGVKRIMRANQQENRKA